MIYTALIYSYSVKLFVVQRWIICTTLNDLYYVEWFIQRWAIFYFLEKFVQPQMICTMLKDSYYLEWFGVRSMICTILNHLGYDQLLCIDVLINARCAYLKKCCKIFYTNIWVSFFLIWKYQEERFSAQPLKLVIKRCWSYRKSTQKTWRMNWHVAAMISYICFLFFFQECQINM